MAHRQQKHLKQESPPVWAQEAYVASLDLVSDGGGGGAVHPLSWLDQDIGLDQKHD